MTRKMHFIAMTTNKRAGPTLCESCLDEGYKTEAVGNCKNPDYAGYLLCAECIQEYDSRSHGIIEAGNERIKGADND